jgi:hypothetical protein
MAIIIMMTVIRIWWFPVLNSIVTRSGDARLTYIAAFIWQQSSLRPLGTAWRLEAQWELRVPALEVLVGTDATEDRMHLGPWTLAIARDPAFSSSREPSRTVFASYVN